MGATKTRSGRALGGHDGRAYDDATRTSFGDIVTYLQEMFGQKLVAHMAGVSDYRRVAKWAEGENSTRETERRLRLTYRVVRLIVGHDSPEVVRAWFIGMNPQLDNDAPADCIHEGDLKRVLAAAEAFIAGG